jgi:hypothetical protein
MGKKVDPQIVGTWIGVIIVAWLTAMVIVIATRKVVEWLW